jgi:hypothetical protein
MRLKVTQGKNGDYLLLVDSNFSFFRRDRLYVDEKGEPLDLGEWIPILNVTQKHCPSLAGEKIPSGLESKIENPDLRKKIETAFKNRLLHIKYMDKRAGKEKVFHNVRLYYPTTSTGLATFVWSANDHNDHSFEYNDGSETRKVTVNEYYKEKRGIDLLYPNMPMVYIKSRDIQGYFPVEMLFQAQEKIVGHDSKVSTIFFCACTLLR